MSEARAWLRQAYSDYETTMLLAPTEREEIRCQLVAKSQQAVEKSVKAVVSALNDANIVGARIGYRHDVERFMHVLIHLPRRASTKPVQQMIWGVFSQHVRSGVRALETLVPRAPAAGQDPARNTEYPFLEAGTWKAPADAHVFSVAEVERFRSLAGVLVRGCAQIVSSVERTP